MQAGRHAGGPKIRVTYLYDHKRRLRGAVACDGTHLGYSYAHKHDLAKCSKKLSRRIALGRMLTCGVDRDHAGQWFRVRGDRSYYIPREVYPVLEAWRQRKENACQT